MDVVSYCRLAEGKVDRTAEATESILVDVDADGKVLGVEVIGDGNWLDGLAALAMKGRLRVVPASACYLSCKRPQLACHRETAGTSAHFHLSGMATNVAFCHPCSRSGSWSGATTKR